MRESQSILEKIAKGFLSATILFSPNCANDGPNPTPRPPEADAVRVERVANGVAYWLDDKPEIPDWKKVEELEEILLDLGKERINYIIEFALHSHPLAFATVELVNSIPSVGHDFTPIISYYLKTPDSGWTKQLTVDSDEEILVAVVYQPGEAMIPIEHNGIKAEVSKGPAGQTIDTLILLRADEFSSDAPDFLASNPYPVWHAISKDTTVYAPFVDRVYTFGPSSREGATLIVKHAPINQTPTPTPRPTPTPTPEPQERFSSIPAGTYVGQVTKEVYLLGEPAEELSSNSAYVSFEFDNFGRRMLTNTRGVRKAAEIGDEYRFGEETRIIIGAGGLENTATYTFTTSSEFFDEGNGFEVFGYDGDLKIHAEAGVVGFYDEVLDGTISKQ